MKHRIVVLGAGYAGAFAAGNLARRLSPADVEVTVVNAAPDFVERMRLHQLAAGQDLSFRPLAEVFAGTGVRLRRARVTALHPERRTVELDGGDELGYDTLLYALGSAAADRGVPGVAEHAHDVTGLGRALRLRERLAGLGAGAAVLVVGEGPTGIETATELAEARPDLAVALAARAELGAALGPRARRHLRRAFDRLGVTVHEHTRITAVEPGLARTADGRALPAAATVWAAGFAVPSLAAAAGLRVDEDGRVLVDAAMRSLSHPEIHAIGDCAHATGANGRPLPMSCASAGATAAQATAAIVARLTGRQESPAAPKYYGNHLSLGRRDAVFQMVDAQARAKSWYLGGRAAARLKAGVLAGAGWGIAHPTFGVPHRRRRLAAAAAAPGRSPQRAAA